jgi:hypothetical protein
MLPSCKVRSQRGNKQRGKDRIPNWGPQMQLTYGCFPNNSVRIRINRTGNVGIGTTNPITKLYVNGSGSFVG